MPQAQTVEAPLRFPLVTPPQNRDGSPLKDGRLVNCYAEKIADKEYAVRKRPGYGSPINPSGGSATGQGMVSFNDLIYEVFADKLYQGVTLIGTLPGATNGVYFFSEAIAPLYIPPYWLASYPFTLSQVIIPNPPNGFSYIVTVPGTSSTAAPSWPLVIGNTVTDGGVTWKCKAVVSTTTIPTLVISGGNTIYLYDTTNGLRPATHGSWVALTAFSLNAIVYPNPPNGFSYQATIPGTSAAAAPVWPTVVYNTVTDGTITWTCYSADALLPTTLCPGAPLLDGTLYTMDPQGNIYGSQINDPNTWDPLNKIVAGLVSGKGIMLSQHLSYIVALKEFSTEFFYDAANSAGSPLGRVPGMIIYYGSLSANAVQTVDGKLIYLCHSREGSAQVGKIDQGSFSIVSTPFIDKLLDEWDFSSIRSFIHKAEGHTFYILTSIVTNMTVVYDIDEDIWCQWGEAAETSLLISASCTISSSVITHYWQDRTNGNYYIAELATTNDNGYVFPVDIYTPAFEGGVRRKKTLAALEIEGDTTPGSILQARCTDDDYQTWTNYRNIDLSTTRPRLNNCGTFVRRAYNFHHQSDTQMHLRAVHLQLDLGTL